MGVSWSGHNARRMSSMTPVFLWPLLLQLLVVNVVAASDHKARRKVAIFFSLNLRADACKMYCTVLKILRGLVKTRAHL